VYSVKGVGQTTSHWATHYVNAIVRNFCQVVMYGEDTFF